MGRSSRFAAVFVAGLLLTAPVAWACGELGASMSNCPMGGMERSMEPSMCDEGNDMSMDCCDARSAPESTPAVAFEGPGLLDALDVAALAAATPYSREASPAAPPPLAASALHDLGRYTLYASFLL